MVAPAPVVGSSFVFANKPNRNTSTFTTQGWDIDAAISRFLNFFSTGVVGLSEFSYPPK